VPQIGGPPAPETLRNGQLARRQRIVRAGLRALANTDHDQVKITEVARDAGVALGTVYHYFSSKEHLFAAVFVEWQGAMRKKLRKDAPKGDTEEDRLRDIFHRTIRAFQLQPQFFRVVLALGVTTDPYAADLFQETEPQFRSITDTAFGGPPDQDRAAILHTVNAVMLESLRSWVMNRITIQDVYSNVDNAIRLIYGSRPEQPPVVRQPLAAGEAAPVP
jgi:TetR/AcrR family transcriptional regulator, cholesterol catabolism regulator